jgi:hypothetical protein
MIKKKGGKKISESHYNVSQTEALISGKDPSQTLTDIALKMKFTV